MGGEEYSIPERSFAVKKRSTEDAVPDGDFIIMVVPDAVLGKISPDVVPKNKENATFILIDPAAAYADEVLLRGLHLLGDGHDSAILHELCSAVILRAGTDMEHAFEYLHAPIIRVTGCSR